MSQTIKMFLASSSELKEDREAFEQFIGRKNKTLMKSDQFIELVIWEDFIDAMSQTRLQDEYNKAVKECDIFVMLFATKVGPYTREEFEAAFGQFQATNKPLIYTYFKTALVDLSNVSSRDLKSLEAFKKRLKALGHFWTKYNDSNDLINHFSGQLEKRDPFSDVVQSKAALVQKPLEWQALYKAFKQRQLHQIQIKHVGGGYSGPESLDLETVFFEQDAGTQVIDNIFSEEVNLKLTGDLRPLLKQAELWKSHLWRFSQETRFQLPQKMTFKEKEEADLFKAVIAEFTSLADKEPCVADSRRFEHFIQEISQKLKLEPATILSSLNFFLNTTIDRKPVLEQLKPPCSAIVIADAGMGKTTLMRRLSLQLFSELEKGLKPELAVPLFVRLDKIADYLKEDQPLEEAKAALLNYVCAHWTGDLVCKDDLTVSSIQQYQKPIQLILDGLDEIPSAKLRLKLATVAFDLTRSGKLFIIITSRPTAVNEGLLQMLGFREIRLLELSPQQIKKFVEKFFWVYLFKDKEAGERDAKTFLEALELSAAAQEFAPNPLHLTVMSLMHKKNNVLPRRRIELYAEFYVMLLLQRSSDQSLGKIADRPVFKKNTPKGDCIIWGEDEYTPLLRRLAFLTHSADDDSVSITNDNLIRALSEQRLADDIKGITVEALARAFLDWADEKLGLLVCRQPLYGFSHRSLQEYLAAMHLAESDSKEIQQFWSHTALKKPDRWLEVSRLLFSEIRKKSWLFSYLEEQWIRDIADTTDPSVISLITASLVDLEEFFQQQGSIRTLHERVACALRARRDKTHQQPLLFLSCCDSLSVMNEPNIDVANPPLVFIDPKQPFNMGSEEDNDGKPVHPVRLLPYWIGKYPVTNKEFAEFVKQGGYVDGRYWFDQDSLYRFDGRDFLKELKETLPSYWMDERFGRNRPLAPVVGISWYEAMAYCRWWTLTFGQRRTEQHQQQVIMRLPTEAEWEYACRAGTTTPFSTGDNLTTEQANYDGNYPYKNYPKGKYLGKTTPVGSYPPNAWELYDMHGNVWEWCSDWYDSNYYAECKKKGIVENPIGPETGSIRVLRGGCWLSDARSCRSADRFSGTPDYRGSSGGFRLVFVP